MRGRRNKEVIQLLLRNSREPVNVGGDFASQLAALDIGVKGLHRIARRYRPQRLARGLPWNPPPVRDGDACR